MEFDRLFVISKLLNLKQDQIQVQYQTRRGGQAQIHALYYYYTANISRGWVGRGRYTANFSHK